MFFHTYASRWTPRNARRMVTVVAIVVALLFAAPGVRAQSQAAFNPPHSDNGLDTDGNVVFNFLQINIELSVSTAGGFTLFVDLYDGSGTFYITTGFANVVLPTGFATVTVDLPGVDIYNSGFDGPYLADLSLYDDTFNLDDFAIYLTGAYLYTDFQGPGALFAPPHSDSGVDTDADLLFDILRVNVSVDVIYAGDYDVNADAFDSFFNYIETVFMTVALSPGPGQTVVLDFTGYLFRANGVDGPYTINLNLYETFGPFLDSDTHLTAGYLYTDFDPPPATFAPPHTDSGIDTDADLLFDILRVNATVDVGAAGDYSVSALAFDSFFNFIDSAFVSVTLPAGPGRVIALDFTGYLFRLNGVDGPYMVSLDLYDGVGNPLDSDVHATAAYLFTDFELPPAALIPPHSDVGVDTDGDILFNAIEVGVSVQVDTAGDFVVQIIFWDATNTTFLGTNSTFTTLGAGPQTVPVWMPTLSMVVANISGPYNVDIFLRDGLGNPLDQGTHYTSNYSTGQFDPIPATFAPPHADVGEDRDAPPDGEFNFLRVDVSLTVFDGGTFLVGGTLWDAGNTTIIASEFRFVSLAVGNQTVSLFFSGVAIRQSGFDGPYNVQLDLLSVPSFITLDSDLHMTGPYSSSAFQTVVPATIDGTVLDSGTLLGIPFASVTAVDYQNGFALTAVADGTGAYSLNAHVGDWVMLFDEFAYDAAIAFVTVTGPTTFNASLDPVAPAVQIVTATIAPWDTVQLQFTGFIDEDIMGLRWQLDWVFGDRDQTLSQAEWDFFLQFIGFTPPTPLNSTWDSFLTDSIWYELTPGTDSFAYLDVAGPIDSTVPIRVEQSAQYQNTTIATAPTHTITANVAYDTAFTDNQYSVFLPPGYVLTSFIGATNVTITGVGTETVAVDPGVDPDPFDGNVSVWITLVSDTSDATNPVVSSASASPDPAVTGTGVTFSASAADDSAVSAVRLEVWNPSGGLALNVSMNPVGGGNYQYTGFSPVPIGTWTLTVTAMDFAGNTGSRGGSFSVIERNPPLISAPSDSPDPQEYGQPVLFAAAVSDDTGLASVTVEVRDSGGAVVGNFTMVYNATSGDYEYTAIFLELGVNTYTVWARDVFDNFASAGSTFTIQDTIAPALSGAAAAPDPVEVGTVTTISVTATDLAGIATVTVAITDPNSVLVGTFPMTAVGGGVYDYDFTPAVLGVYTFTTNATDVAANWRTASGGFTSQDSTNPLANAGSDQTVTEGALVTFNGVGSTDNIAVTNWTWEFTVNSVLIRRYGSAPTYTFTTAGTYVVTLTVRDAAGNVDTDTVTITVLPPDSSAPVAHAGADQTVDVGQTVTFNGSSSTDNIAVTNWTWEFTEGATTVRLYGSSVTHRFDTAGSYTVTLTVRDAVGNDATDTVTVTVRSPDTGVFGLPGWAWIAIVAIIAGIVASYLFMRRKKAPGAPAPAETGASPPPAEPPESPPSQPMDEETEEISPPPDM